MPTMPPILTRTLAAAVLLAGLAAPVGAVEARSFGEVSYLTGGIRLQGRDEMMPAREQYTLRLPFAYSSGSYLADIAVTVADRAGNTLLKAFSDGPYLWARLPPGSYRVTASHAGEAQTRQVKVPAAGAADVSFFWAPLG